MIGATATNNAALRRSLFICKVEEMLGLAKVIEFAPCRLLQKELVYRSSKRHGVKHKR